MDASVEETRDAPKKAKRRRRLAFWGIAIVVVAVLLVTFPTLWGPKVVAHFIRNAIATPELGGTLEAVDRVSLHSFEMRGLRLGAVPGTPELDRVSARYSPGELLRHKRLDSAAATGFRMNLAEAMPTNAAALFTNHWIEAEAHLTPLAGSDDGMSVVLTGHALDWPLRGEAAFGLSFTNGFGLRGNAIARIPDTDWMACADYEVTTNGWDVSAFLNERDFDETDPVLGPIAMRALAQAPGVSNLLFRGTASAEVTAEFTKAMPVPVWSVQGVLSNAAVSLVASEMPVSLEGIRTRVGVSGIANHWDLRPVFPMFESGRIGEVPLQRGWARLLADERSVSISEAAIGVCDGYVRVYALSFLPERFSAGFTLYVDDIDAGQFLCKMPEFHGTATGRLHGKIPIWLVDGRQLRLRNSFLYSPPGEIGKLRMDDTTVITDNLMASGVSKATCDNLSRALKNLDYSVLRLDLKREEGEDSTLVVRLEGTATEGKTTVPVDFSVSFHGALERLLNFGIKAATGPQGTGRTPSHSQNPTHRR